MANLGIVAAHRALRELLASSVTGVLADIPGYVNGETVPGKYRISSFRGNRIPRH